VWGKQGGWQSDPRFSAVHPHVCGENKIDSRFNGRGVGTPPRVWGKPSGPGSTPSADRYTPTCVGKTNYANAR